jgi:hypothetical protein
VEDQRAARSGTRGGGSIQAASQIRARIAAGGVALLGAAGFGAGIAFTAHDHERELLVLAIAAVVLLAIALAGAFSSLVPWALVLLAAEYVWRIAGGEVDQWSPLYAAALLAIAELSYWSIELRGRTHDAERLNERRVALIVVLALATVVCGGVVLAATSVPIGRGVAIDLLGAAAAVAALGVVATIARGRHGADRG